MCVEQRALGVLRALVGALGDGVRGFVAARDFDQLRLVQQLVGEALDLVGKRRREQQVLALCRHRQQRHDPLDVRDEAHVQHAVGLVQHEDLDLAQVDALVFDVVQQAARRGDQDLDAGADDGQLLLDVDAAEHAGGPQSGVLAVFLDRFLDLDRQFPRRRQDQRAHGVAGGGGAGVGVLLQPLQDRQRKAGGLAGAGLRATHHVEARQDDGDGLGLDGRGRGVAGFGHGPQNFRAETEL